MLLILYLHPLVRGRSISQLYLYFVYVFLLCDNLLIIIRKARQLKNFSEKQKNYVDLKMELSQLWQSTVHIVPIIVGALESIPKNLESMLEKLDISPSVIPSFQRSVLYSTASILRRHITFSCFLSVPTQALGLSWVLPQYVYSLCNTVF